jgi:NAD-dependent deacetylase
MESYIQKAKDVANLIKAASNIVALTGAGISTNAGIPDFRGPNGIYVTKRYDPIETFDLKSFYKNPVPFYSFTKELLSVLENAQPTFSHKFLKKLEDMGKLKAIITQNIDMLHQKAGSKIVYEVHGSYIRSKCVKCNKTYSFDQIKEKIFKDQVPLCDECHSLIKPDIVFFGEQVKYLNESILAVSNSDLLIVIGTSLKIYPVSLVPYYAKNIVVVNNGDSSIPREKILVWADGDIDEFFEKVDKFL